MRRLFLPLAVLLIAVAAAACAGTPGPDWTYAPPTAAPSVTPAPSGEASAAPSAGASAAPSAGASAGTPTEVPGGTGGVVQVSALNIAFEQSEVTAPAGTAFTIHFENKDASVPHDIAIKDASGMQMFKGDPVTGPGAADYQVPALAAGTYQFVCTIHPNMVGTLKVGG